MKIENKLKNNLTPLRPSKKNKLKTSSKKIKFLEELKRVHGEDIKTQLDELLDLIDKQGEKLEQNRTFKELIRYKKMVKRFIKDAIDKMYQKKEDYSPMQGKVHTTVRTINSSLEELTEIFVNDKASQLDILDKLDEVRGMLVDLYR